MKQLRPIYRSQKDLGLFRDGLPLSLVMVFVSIISTFAITPLLCLDESLEMAEKQE